MNLIKFEPHGDLVDRAFSQFNENLNQEPHSQTENDETPWAQYPNENDLENRKKTPKNLQFLTLFKKILPDDEIGEGINSINSKPKEFFNMAYTWNKDYVKYDGHDVEPVHIFVSGSGGTSKSHLEKVIYRLSEVKFLNYR